MINNQKSFLFFIIVTLFSGLLMRSQQQQDSLGFYYKLALNPKEPSDFAKAYDYFIQHKAYCIAHKNTVGAIYDLRLLAIIQNESGFYHDSETSAIEAIAMLEKMPDDAYSQEAKIGLYNQLGKVSRALKRPDRALMHYNEALKIATQPEQQNRIINNRGFIYLDENEFEKALTEFENAYQISQEINDEKEMARNLDNMGYAKFKLGRPDALDNLELALEKRLALNDAGGIYASYDHLFEYYRAQKDEQNALLNLSKSYSIANTLNSDAYKLDVLSAYMDLSTDTLVTAYKELSDKIRLDNLLTENKYASRKYDFSQKELEAQKNKALKERWQIAIVVVIILGVLLYLLVRMQHKKANIYQIFQTETRISKKIHDELANDVSDLMSYVENELDASVASKLKLLNNLEDVYLRTRDISTETASVDFKHFPNTLKNLLIQHNKPQVRVVTNTINTIPWEKVPEHKKLTIYRVLQELMVNMKKHSQAQLVSVMFKKNKNKYEIWYADDGVGCDLSIISLNGLKNAESRMKEIGGRITFDTSQGHGFKAIITFK